MRINGEWHLCDDGVVRPIVRGEILTGTGLWQATEFLVDTGADRTVFNVPVLTALRLQPVVSPHRLGGSDVPASGAVAGLPDRAASLAQAVAFEGFIVEEARQMGKTLDEIKA
jgi:hypothetical protein